MSLEKEPLPGENEGKQKQGFTRLQMIATTIVVFYGNITYGAAMNAFSPSLTDFKKKFSVDTETISVVFTASTGCFMVGALTCSVIYNYVNRQFVVILLFVGMAFSMFIAPHVPTPTTFYLIGGFLGFTMGCYETAQFVWIMEMWQSKSPPLVQGQHFMYSVGAMLPPLIMAPFLTKEEDEVDEDDMTAIISSTGVPAEKNKRLFVPFTILGCFCALTAVAQALLFVFMRYKAPPPELENKVVATKEEDRSGNFIQRLWPGWELARLVFLSILIVGFDQGTEIGTMQYFPTFGQNSDLGLSEKESAHTFTGVTAGFAVGRGIAIPLVFKIPPEYLLFTDIVIVLIGNIILIAWGNTSLTMLWIAGILYGLGYSSLLPSFCAYMERYLIFTNTVGSLMIICGSLLGAIYPLIVGKFIDDYPLVMTYPIFVGLGIIIASTATAYWITTLSKRKKPIQS